MRKLSLPIKTAITLAALLAATTAQAALTTYTSQASYLAAVGNTGIDDFNDLTSAGYIGPLSRTAGAYGYSVSSSPNSPVLYGAGPTGDAWLSTNNARDAITFNNFTGGSIAGAGGYFFGSNIAGGFTSATELILKATDSTGATLTYSLANPGTSSFLGFVSTGLITSLSVSVTQPGSGFIWPTVNNLNLSVSAVPEPETYGMMLAGLGMLGLAARRRNGAKN
ncbi:PEP-CTERM sorting domain-containing protein [Duganella rivi]|uniref:PEP-CTERM sorting domain-containing protein n=1 Tax=Duganella rivi TaxID=2666083 RepID=UPI0035314FEE